MKFFTKKSIIQKIVFTIIIILLVSFTLAPYGVYADTDDDDDGWSLAGSLAKEIMQLFSWFGDVIMGALNNFMLGANGFGSAMLSTSDSNFNANSGSWLYVDPNSVNLDDDRTIAFESGTIDTSSFLPGTKYEIPNMLYSPENIFANNIAALDINFLRANTYQSIYVSGDSEFQEDADAKAVSTASELRAVIASWYKSFRNIAVVGLLSVLIYLGIRILLSSTATDKAKYKENLQNWVVALCLIFVIHFIMSAVLMLTDKCTELFSSSINDGYVVTVKNENVAFKTNLIGLVRFSAQSKSATTAGAYHIIYWALVIYTCIFTIMYFKRFLYMAFFTMIAPLVALTYPIDRAGDGKAQAFNMWFKEYTMNAIIQPVHLILYTVFVGSAYELVAKNPVYALVAIGFLVPAEKFIKKMFGLDKAESPSAFGSLAGGALAMSGLKQLSNLGSGGKGNKGKVSKSEDSDKSADKGIYMPSNNAGDLSAFGSDNDEDEKVDVKQKMLNTNDENFGTSNLYDENFGTSNWDDENFGTLDWDAQQRDALAREENKNDEGKQYSDEEYKQILRDSGYDEDAINEMMLDNKQDNQPFNVGKNIEGGQSTSGGEKKRRVISCVGRVADRGASKIGRQIWKNKGKIAKGVARTALKTGTRAVGAAALASVGLAAGLTTGDFSKTSQFMGAGALAGSALGGNIYNRTENLASNVPGIAGNARSAWEEERYGLQVAQERQRQRQNKKAKNSFMNDEKEIKKYKELKAKMNYKGDVKNLMEAASDYKEAGITDDKLIQNALQAEHVRDNEIGGKNHEKFVSAASFAHEYGFGQDTINDDKKRTQFDNVLENNTKLNNKQRREVALMTADIFDSRATYEKSGRFGKDNKTKGKK